MSPPPRARCCNALTGSRIHRARPPQIQRRASALLVGCALGIASPCLSAEPRLVPGALPDATPNAACAEQRMGALRRAACAIAADIGPVNEGALVVPASIERDASLQRPIELAARMASLIASALGPRVRSVAEPATLSFARSLARSAKQLVFVRIQVADGALRMSAELYPIAGRFWDRVKNPAPDASRRAVASQALDAEAKAFFADAPSQARKIEKIAALDRDTVALACTSAKLGGSVELVLAGRRRVTRARIDKGALAVFAARAWSDVSPVAAHPLREPIAGIATRANDVIDVGSSDRADAVRFDAGLSPLAHLGRRIPWPTGGCSSLLDLSLDGSVTPCAATDPAGSLRFGVEADAIASDAVTLADGSVRVYHALRIANESVALVRDDAGHGIRVEAVGAQLAIADLDLDGQPELVTTRDTLDPAQDFVLVRTWPMTGALVERFRIPVPSGVRALAVCPAQSAGPRILVIATSDELWLVR